MKTALLLWMRDVGKQKSYQEDEEELILKLEDYRRRLREVMADKSFVLTVFKDEINKAKEANKIAGLAKLAEDYNSKIKGLNKEITQRIISSVENNNLLLAGFKIEIYESFAKKLNDVNINEILFNIQDIEHKLIGSMYKMVTDIALNLKKKVISIDIEDLIQAGNEELIKAVKRYKSSFETKLGTYLYNCIETKILTYIANTSREIRIPEHRIDLISLIIKAKNSFNYPPTIKELTKKINEIKQKKYIKFFSEKEVEGGLLYVGDIMININLSLGDRITIEDMLSLPSEEITDQSDKNLSFESLYLELNSLLSKQEAAVIYFKYLDSYYIGNSPKSFLQIQDNLKDYFSVNEKINRDNVSKYEKSGLKKLLKKSKITWEIFRDKFLYSLLNEEEINILFYSIIYPMINNEKRKSWSSISQKFDITNKEAIKISREIRKKMRRNFSGLERNIYS